MYQIWLLINQGLLKVKKSINHSFLIMFKINEIAKKFCWLERDKFLPKLHLRQPEFVYSTCWPFKHRKRLKRFRETCNLKHPYRNKLDKVSIAHDAAYSYSKDLAKRTVSDKILKELMKLLEILNMMDIKEH